jgi:hypothetical protein
VTVLEVVGKVDLLLMTMMEFLVIRLINTGCVLRSGGKAKIINTGQIILAKIYTLLM